MQTGYARAGALQKGDNVTKRIRLVPDEYAQNPRNDYDRASVLVAYHKRYNLADKNAPKLNTSDYSGWGDLEEALRREENVVALLPVYMYDHSGLRVSTTPFECRWDSGQIGFIYISRQNLTEFFGYKNVTEPRRKQLLAGLEAEIQEFDTYLSQGRYGYVVEEQVNGEWEKRDSCWGFIGYDREKNGMAEHLGSWLQEGYKIQEE